MSQRISHFTAHGNLTRYALGCGYVEAREFAGVKVELWKELGCYHVNVHDFRDKSWGRVCRESTGSLKQAREYFSRGCRVARALAK